MPVEAGAGCGTTDHEGDDTLRGHFILNGPSGAAGEGIPREEASAAVAGVAIALGSPGVFIQEAYRPAAARPSNDS